MSIFSKFFKKQGRDNNGLQPNIAEAVELQHLGILIDDLLSCTHYVPKSEYINVLPKYRNTVEYFYVLKNSGMLDSFCKQNGLDSKYVEGICNKYAHFETLIDEQNDRFVNIRMAKDKEYLDNILKECDPNIMLDEDQRKVVLTEEDYCLVVAGAGAGKTTTVAAKVKYLVEKKNVDPKQILVISFTNKAVNELKQRIVGELHINCPIATFHSTGNAIIRKQKQKLNIVDNTKLYYVVRDYFRSSILKNESIVNNLILFFASYFDAPYEGEDINGFFNNIAKANFSTMRSEFDDFKQEIIDRKTKRRETILSEFMRSNQEVEIANFLYMNNLEYEYEPLYKYDILCSRKPYTPDFVIKEGEKLAYIEHFGITEDGKNNRYSQDQLETYKNAIRDKIKLHKKHGTTLIYTFSSYKDGRGITEHLQEALEEKGFVLTPRSNKEVMEKIITSEENRYIRKLVNLICRFITNFKTNGYTEDEFARMYHSTKNVRTRLFLSICMDCYLEYQHYLKENDAVDFEDMINESTVLLREIAEMKYKLNFKYIIVDEYQDISRQRFDLVTELHKVTEAKIVAVGDDWQSIYAFSGSDITLFTNFAEKMGYAKMLKIVRTYRNAQEVIDIAGNFIQKNATQIQKALISNKSIDNPIIIYTYDSTRKDPKGDNRSGVNYAIAHATEVALEKIMEYNKAEGKPVNSPILLLGRFGFDGDRLEKSGLFEYITWGSKIRSVKYPKLNITFMTAHSSKGLGYDNVIVINGRNETYGFPSKIEDDPVLSFVIKGDRSIEHAEERRLFYVAMTRTKNRVFFIAPKQNPSEFLLELKRDYKNVDLEGDWQETAQQNLQYKKFCPICGYPLQYRYKNAYGLKLHICTNEPEICGFMTNEYGAGKLSIIKCDQCRDGYLIVRPGNNDYFLGCTNYKKDGTGCNRVMARQYFYDYAGIKEDPTKGVSIAEERRDTPTPEGKIAEVEKNIKPEIADYKVVIQEPPIVVAEKPSVQKVMYGEWKLNEVLKIILSALSSVSERKYYGVHILTDVLRGSENQRIIRGHLDRVNEYGRLSKMKREDIVAIIGWLIENKYILQTKGQYPVLHPTYNGLHYNEAITKGQLEKLLNFLKG